MKKTLYYVHNKSRKVDDLAAIFITDALLGGEFIYRWHPCGRWRRL